MILRADRSTSRLRVASGAALAVSLLGASAAHAQQPAAAPMRPATHTVKRGDTLWDLSKLYLGDPFLWPEIYRINTDKIEDPHWIYPGEVLKLPTDATKVVAAAPAPTPEPARPLAVVTPVEPMTQPPARAEQAMPPLMQDQVRTVRLGEYTAAPWVDTRGGPKGSGFIMAARDIPGIATADRSRISLYDAVVVAPPPDAPAPEHSRFLSYRLGPLIEDFGQIIIPTGIVEITRQASNGDAAIGRVVRMFSDVKQDQRLIPYDSAAAIITARPSSIANGKTGKVRWIYSQPVLPSTQAYIVVDIGRQDVTTGDQIDLYDPRKKAKEGQDYATPEVWIARAQVLRVTRFGATAIITSQQQPKIEEGTAARVAAKMP